MAAQDLTHIFPDADATAAAARALGAMLVPGDVVLLEGNVGAGKTHFARALIQSILVTIEDVPSPTFTLVQTYDTTKGALWHADLYRLSGVAEVDELGLGEAFETAICLVEWPDRLEDLRPASALLLSLEPGPSDDARVLTASWRDPKWHTRMQGWPT